MKYFVTLLLIVAFSTTISAQEKPFKENPTSNDLTPIHFSYEKGELDFLKGLIPLKDQNITKKAVTDNVGDKKNFWVSNLVTGNFDEKEFELVRKGSATQIWFEVAEMALGHLNQAVADSMFKYLEEESNPFSHDPSKGIINLSNEILGSPPDVDGDGLVDFLITDIKDGWTPEGGTGYTAGFFYSVDQYSQVELPLAFRTNERDVLYIDSYPGIYNGGEIDPIGPLSTLSHEYQHLIHFNYNDRLNEPEYTFINEGQSNFASLLSGYFPHSSIGSYLTSTNVPIFRWDREESTLPDYGRAAAFFSYYWEQLGFENSGMLTQSIASGETGINNVLSNLGSSLDFADILVNWGLANLLNDRVNSGSTSYGYSHPFLTNLRSSDIDIVGPNLDAEKEYVQQGGISYLGLGQTTNLEINVAWAGENGEVRLITYSGVEKTITTLNNGQTYSTPDGLEFDNVQLMLVNTTPSPDEAVSTSSREFTITSSGEQSYNLFTASTFSPSIKFYWSLPYYNSTQVGRLGFTNKYTAPLDGIIFALELYIVSGADAQDQPIEVKGSGTLNLSVHEDSNGQPGTELATTAIPFSSIGTGWQTFNVTEWNLPISNGQTFHVVYHFDVSTVDPNVNSVPLRLDDGTGDQDVSFIITEPGSYATMFNDDESNGQHGVWNKVVYGQAIVTSNEEDGIDTPQDFLLSQNYPNPFNPTTNINFSLPEASEVSLTVFNTLGQQVATLVDSQLNSGSHSITWNAQNVPSGIYFYRLKAGNFVQTNKMLLLK